MSTQEHAEEVGSTSTTGTSITVHIPHERPIRVFRGDGDDVEAFIREAAQVIKSRALRKPEDIDLVKSYLEGDARREVSMRQSYDDVKAIYVVLREAFGDIRTVPQLLRAFYDRKQRNGETLRHFSHSLDTLARKIEDGHCGTLPHSENSKRDQFVEGVMDVSLRQNLKHMIRGNSDVSFLEIRKEACLWDDESGGATCQVMANTAPQDTQIVELVTSLTDQVTKLATTVANLTAQRDDGRRPAYQQRRPPSVCYNCGQPGHYARYCTSRPQQRSGNSNPQL